MGAKVSIEGLRGEGYDVSCTVVGSKDWGLPSSSDEDKGPVNIWEIYEQVPGVSRI